MGRIKKGIIGGFAGVVGNVSGSRRNYKDAVSKPKSKLKNKSNVSDQEQNVSFSEASDFYRDWSDLLIIGLEAIDFDTVDLRNRIIKGRGVVGMSENNVGWDNVIIVLPGTDYSDFSFARYRALTNALTCRLNRVRVYTIRDSHVNGTVVKVGDNGLLSVNLNRNISGNGLADNVNLNLYNAGDRIMQMLYMKNDEGRALSNMYICCHIVE